MVINTGIFCSHGGTVSLSNVAIGENATVIVSGDETSEVIVTDDQE
ncbi:hypothetical protein AB0J43_01320 [Nonomuraea fuscirosea]